ncbi:MAG TPA: flagellar motor stator protein MotA [Candidatus Acidoferrum sp.]|nr:flagellar motor stator protein MotA [Candidatus Acidoferrum sp.]
MALVGILIVLGCIAGGFAIAGGHFPVLIQPAEFVVIIGAAVGALLATAPGRMRSRVMKAIKAAFKDGVPKKGDYMDILKLQYELFVLMRREGVLALEQHVSEPAKSALFKKYPSLFKSHHAKDFLVDALMQVVNGTSPDDLDQLLDSELDTLKEEGHLPVGLIKTIGDSLPGIGIVAAVLGIIVTMGHMDAPPAVIGLHVAAALVGTFLGILLCYGIAQPLANNAEFQEMHQLRYLQCIRAGLVASVRGASPPTAVEFARKVIFSDERPNSAEVEKALKALKAGG